MTSLLLIISFLLHVVILIAVFQLYQQNQQMKQERDNTLNTKMQQFIDEIKQENKYLQQQLSIEKSPPTVDNLHENLTGSDQRVNPTRSNQISERHPTTNHERDDNLITDLTETRQEEMELSLEGKILQLHKAGLAIEDIAEQLTCGKTEVELIIHLQQQLRRNI